MRIKFIKSHAKGRRGETIEVSPNEGFGLIDSGFAEVTKDLVPDDYKQAGDTNGKSTIIRPLHSK